MIQSTKLIVTTLMLGALTGCAGVQQTGTQDMTIHRTVDRGTEAPVDAYNNLGLQYMKIGRFDNAQQAIAKALSHDPSNPVALNAMALILQKQNDPINADAFFKRALASDQANPMVYNNYGAFLFGEKRFDEACVHFEKAATIDLFYHGRSQAYENLGLCQLERQQIGLAEKAFQRSVDIGFRSRAMTELIVIKAETGQIDAAQTLLRRAEPLLTQNGASLDPRLIEVKKGA
jgi:type IV pilus assembly protein PilF